MLKLFINIFLVKNVAFINTKIHLSIKFVPKTFYEKVFKILIFP